MFKKKTSRSRCCFISIREIFECLTFDLGNRRILVHPTLKLQSQSYVLSNFSGIIWSIIIKIIIYSNCGYSGSGFMDKTETAPQMLFFFFLKTDPPVFVLVRFMWCGFCGFFCGLRFAVRFLLTPTIWYQTKHQQSNSDS